MPYFRKKPVVIEAIQFVPGTDAGDKEAVARWLSRWNATPNWIFAPDCIEIPTLEGVMTAGPGWWILRGVKGEFYPCDPDIFALTYEPVPGPLPPATADTPAGIVPLRIDQLTDQAGQEAQRQDELDELRELSRQQDEEIYQTLICGAGVPEHILRGPDRA